MERKDRSPGQKWKSVSFEAATAAYGLRGAEISAGDHGTAGSPGCASQVVLHVSLRLDVLTELDHHDVRYRVAVLANKLK